MNSYVDMNSSIVVLLSSNIHVIIDDKICQSMRTVCSSLRITLLINHDDSRRIVYVKYSSQTVATCSCRSILVISIPKNSIGPTVRLRIRRNKLFEHATSAHMTYLLRERLMLVNNMLDMKRMTSQTSVDL
jgi:hypothetical protein